MPIISYHCKVCVSVLQDEVIAVSEKVIVRLEDLVKWTVWDPHAWNKGMRALPLRISTINRDRSRTDSSLHYQGSTLCCGLHFKDVLKEKVALGKNWHLMLLCRAVRQRKWFQCYFHCRCYNCVARLTFRIYGEVFCICLCLSPPSIQLPLNSEMEAYWYSIPA